jgi:hypothetical protein
MCTRMKSQARLTTVCVIQVTLDRLVRQVCMGIGQHHMAQGMPPQGLLRQQHGQQHNNAQAPARQAAVHACQLGQVWVHVKDLSE